MSDHGSFTQKVSADHGFSGLSFRRLTNDPRSYSLFHIPAPRILVLSTINEQRSLHFQAKPRTMDVSKNMHRAANLNLEGGVTVWDDGWRLSRHPRNRSKAAAISFSITGKGLSSASGLATGVT